MPAVRDARLSHSTFHPTRHPRLRVQPRANPCDVPVLATALTHAPTRPTTQPIPNRRVPTPSTCRYKAPATTPPTDHGLDDHPRPDATEHPCRLANPGPPASDDQYPSHPHPSTCSTQTLRPPVDKSEPWLRGTAHPAPARHSGLRQTSPDRATCQPARPSPSHATVRLFTEATRRPTHPACANRTARRDAPMPTPPDDFPYCPLVTQHASTNRNAVRPTTHPKTPCADLSNRPTSCRSTCPCSPPLAARHVLPGSSRRCDPPNLAYPADEPGLFSPAQPTRRSCPARPFRLTRPLLRVSTDLRGSHPVRPTFQARPLRPVRPPTPVSGRNNRPPSPHRPVPTTARSPVRTDRPTPGNPTHPTSRSYPRDISMPVFPSRQTVPSVRRPNRPTICNRPSPPPD